MFINEVIKQIMKVEDMTLLKMANAIGKKRPNDISARLAHNNLSFSTAIEMLTALNYEIQIVPKGSALPVNGYQVEQEQPKIPNPKVWTKDGKIKLAPVNSENE